MLEVKNLSISIGNKPIINDISFVVNKGKTLGIVGESGSGKSITSLSLIGLLPQNSIVTSGNAIFNVGDKKVDLLKLTEKEFQKIRGKQIAMIFQEPQTCLNPSMLCGKQLLEAIENNTELRGKIARSKCIELLIEMQLQNPQKIYNSYPHQISGGQKQRVMIAMAIAGNPRILIADEPTTALDVTVQRELIILLRQLQLKYQMGMIFISHDLGVISEIADDLIVMKDGGAIELGVAKQVINYPVKEYTQALIASRPNFNSRPHRLKTIDNFLSAGVERETPKIDLIGSESVINALAVTTSYVLKRNFWGKPLIYFNALNNVSFELFEGEVLGLVGESGSGKTTLGRTILKLVDHRGGCIHYKGTKLKELTGTSLKTFRREVQLIFQDPYSSLNPRMTIGQVLSEPLMVHGITRSKKECKLKVSELLDKVGLDAGSYNRYPHEFSGGQRQRIVIARALALNPKIIICDEIVSALDVSIQAQILNLLKDLREQYRLTLLFISHDLAVVNYISDRIMVMKDGVLVEVGLADQLFSSPKTEYTKTLVDCIPGQLKK